MDGRELKALWRSGTASFGAWITLADPAAAAAVCNAGYEWVIVDAEHMPYSPESLRSVIAAVRARDTVPIVRVTENNAALIKQTLDWGAEGVMVPLLRSVEDARRAAAACRYPPLGVRGWNPRDATNYYQDVREYAETFNDRVIAMLQVEHIDAVNNLDGFLAVPGVDCILIGPADLSFSLGHPLQPDHPEVQLAIDTTIAKCKAAGVPVGIAPGGTVEDLVGWIRRGIDFLPLGFDIIWISQGGHAMLERLREATGGR
jgi:2-keto-3-deoxy-L-rhamnonate aldolase RhmA